MPAGPSSNPGGDLAAAVASARAHPDALRALQALYARLDAELDALDADCRGCGRCCLFGEMGHRLYLSTLELALLAREPPPPAGRRGELECPYQQDNVCTARTRRALGCRSFFCDVGDLEAAQPLYERFHRRLRALHERTGVPYRYVELTTALGSL